MPIDVETALGTLNSMTVSQLRHRYGEVFGEPARSFNKQHLVKRIAWRLQAIHEGDLSERARRRARELANDADLRIRPPAAPGANGNGETTTSAFRVEPDDRLPMPGTLLTRRYKGRLIQVRVLAKGFDYEGELFRSLSAVAKAVTGSHWNGRLFFGLPKPGKEAAE